MILHKVKCVLTHDLRHILTSALRCDLRHVLGYTMTNVLRHILGAQVEKRLETYPETQQVYLSV